MGALGLGHLAGLAAAVGLLAAAVWVLWAARARADEERRVELPGLGKVGNPTCLTLGVCLFMCAYHGAAYSLLPVVALVAVPIGRWWVVASAVVVAVVGALLAEWAEQRGD
ncbi:MAG: hypothetical protein IT431_08905 [Phycisphaerales bacterium]|nr:hypothetical protein [Phycisphaerales bacterium]